MSLTTWNELKERTKRRYKDLPDVQGCSFRIQSITALEFDKHCRRTAKLSKGKSPVQKSNEVVDGHLVSLIAMCLVDENNQPLCPGEEDWKELVDLDHAITEQLGRECYEHIGMKRDGDVEKNSEPTPTSDST